MRTLDHRFALRNPVLGSTPSIQSLSKVGQTPLRQTAQTEAHILDATWQAPADWATHWSTHKLAAQLRVSHMRMAQVLAKHGLKPHRLERYMASTNPDFEAKAADIINLYLNAPQYAAVFCVDEKTAIQNLAHKDPVLPPVKRFR
ncbi:MAG: hypothetical protein JSR29_18355 [Nitrospira sp.]|nr:hypothetical protein [Nitrospira sp.]